MQRMRERSAETLAIDETFSNSVQWPQSVSSLDSPIGVQSILAELSLLPSKSDTGDIAAEILSSVGSERTPSTSDIQKGIFRLKFELVAD